MLCTAEQSEAGQSGAEAAARVGDEVQREARARFKGSRAGISALSSGERDPGGLAGDLGREVDGETAGGARLSDSGRERKSAGIRCVPLETRLTSGPTLHVRITSCAERAGSWASAGEAGVRKGVLGRTA